MDIFIADLNNGKEYVCKDCKSEYKKGKASYFLTLQHESITEGTKKIGNEVIEVKCAHGVTGKCTQCNPAPVANCAHGNDKKTCSVCNKPVQGDKCPHNKIKKDCPTCKPKQSGKQPFSHTVKVGDTYDKLVIKAKQHCNGNINEEDWNPQIKNNDKGEKVIVIGITYTCECPN
jgi:LysM repeat protein